ncbi:glycosyltransferase family 4 protein [Microbacterium sp.]|uniref:glycosyltransferase family 4 protein n=1 Tax=Microbacterium sp. TaxID=51671 RepID=UPI0039E262EC
MSTGDPNVVLIANPGADLYGSDRMALETVRALVGEGRRVVVTVPHTGPLVPLLERAGAEVVECATPIVRKGLLNPRGLWELVLTTLRSIRPGLRLIRETDAGVVIVNTITPPLWLPLSRWSRRLTVCHVHEGEASIASILRRALYIPLLFSHRIIINSRFSLGVLSAALPRLRRRAVVVYNAVAGPETVVPPRDALQSPTRLLFIGRLSHRKGPHVAIEALHRLTEEGRDAHLDLLGAVFPGNEAYAEELHSLVDRWDLGERVTFLGFKPSVWDDISANDIVLIPSTVDEPFGNTAVEAALAARPAVVSEVGGLPEATRASTSATLVPPGDAGRLADAIAATIDGWTSFASKASTDSEAAAEAFSAARYSRELLAALRR